MQLLPHPELQYFAMSALVVLLSSPTSSVFEHPELSGNALEEVRCDRRLLGGVITQTSVLRPDWAR